MDGLAAQRGRSGDLQRVLGPDPHATRAVRPGGDRRLAGANHEAMQIFDAALGKQPYAAGAAFSETIASCTMIVTQAN